MSRSFASSAVILKGGGSPAGAKARAKMNPHRTATPVPTGVLGWLPFLWSRVLFSGTADPSGGCTWRSVLLVLVVPAALLYPCLSFALFEPDEGRYAQIPREMLEAGDWIVPTLQGQ